MNGKIFENNGRRLRRNQTKTLLGIETELAKTDN